MTLRSEGNLGILNNDQQAFACPPQENICQVMYSHSLLFVSALVS